MNVQTLFNTTVKELINEGSIVIAFSQNEFVGLDRNVLALELIKVCKAHIEFKLETRDA